MKVLLLNGSARKNGCTARALKEVEEVLQQQGIETEYIDVGDKTIRGCVACGSNGLPGRFVFQSVPVFQILMEVER